MRATREVLRTYNAGELSLLIDKDAWRSEQPWRLSEFLATSMAARWSRPDSPGGVIVKKRQSDLPVSIRANREKVCRNSVPVLRPQMAGVYRLL